MYINLVFSGSNCSKIHKMNFKNHLCHVLLTNHQHSFPRSTVLLTHLSPPPVIYFFFLVSLLPHISFSSSFHSVSSIFVFYTVCAENINTEKYLLFVKYAIYSLHIYFFGIIILLFYFLYREFSFHENNIHRG